MDASLRQIQSLPVPGSIRPERRTEIVRKPGFAVGELYFRVKCAEPAALVNAMLRKDIELIEMAK